MEALSIQNLKKTYATGVQALQGVSLSVLEGDFFALLGPNGAGKTTIIGIVTGLVNKTAGTVRIFGDDLDVAPERTRVHIGVVPQEFNFNIFEKVENIVVSQAGYYGIPRAQAMRDAEVLLKQLGLWEKRDAQSRMLSGGMKRRLMIARALIHRPRLLILDEPTAGVDIELRRGMWEFLAKINNEGVTIILTTHYLEEAEQLCKNVAIINKGEIIEHGSMRELLSTLENESFLFYLKDPISDVVLGALQHCDIHQVDPTTLEVTLKDGARLNDFIVQLARADVTIQSMRNKSNRLEEIFLSLISGDTRE
ncbi:MAG: ABC transporter [Candidatus Ryanbacteria bacterium RIFCSPHIGHO2_02_FULL_48_12]|uniref:ABC transporter n=1 Tax=Candidatus Ryanbacteria bacterium RIFCSPHIGHO2_01_FULL_48_27 TaxID=1802115 RepID=A0A1G2G586_9BACT|nr:MAG: ABC transporter [Candidatus Ryanbacteria bacterium RIFCSPHIGHO2_01_FULL_48_27]OGZ50405.1 MAG: ABC transporter [Candidatus Ryanbacteria bacterium RIFCSPHIGHO2_02_FULL_48_12]